MYKAGFGRYRREITGAMSVQLTITERGAPTRLDLVMPQEITGSVSVQLTIKER